MGQPAPKITYVVDVCRDTIVPCLMFDIQIEGIITGAEIYIPIDGRLYSDDGKILAQAILETTTFTSKGSIAAPTIIVDLFEKYQDYIQLILNLKYRAFLDAKSINYIEERRKANKYQKVELKLKLRFLKLFSRVYHKDYIYRVGEGSSSRLGLPADAVMLKAGEHLLSVESSEFETQITIEGPRWIKDFLPVLGLGSYILLELPIPKPPLISDEALQHFSNAIESLKKAREAIYETLDIGPPLTALRNALIEVCEALKPLGIASETQDRGCTLVDDKLVELFQGNEEMARLIKEIFVNIKNIATRGPTPTQPHLAPKPAPTLYQVESLMGLTAYMIKLIADTLRYIDTK
ncbi:MAG: hypothetical protein QXE01_02530 [Sulfolobales archaeon]